MCFLDSPLVLGSLLFVPKKIWFGHQQGRIRRQMHLTLVDRTNSSRGQANSFSARPISTSQSPAAYASAVSKKLIP